MNIRDFFEGFTRTDWLQLLIGCIGAVCTLLGTWLGYLLTQHAARRIERRTTRKLALSAIDRAMQAGNAGATRGLDCDAIGDHLDNLNWLPRRRLRAAMRAYRAAHGRQGQDSCGQPVYENPSEVADALNRLRDACR